MKITKFFVYRTTDEGSTCEGRFVHFSDAYSFSQECYDTEKFGADYIIKEERL